MNNIVYHLDDWLTTDEFPFFSKIVSTADNVLHDHTFFEIFYMLEGDIPHELNGKTSLLHQGDLLFLRPGEIHSFLRKKGVNCRHRDIILRKEFFKTICDFLNIDLYESFVNDKTCKMFSLTKEKISEYEKNFFRITQESAFKNNYGIALALAKAQCTELISMLLPLATKTEEKDADWLTMLINHLSDPACFSKNWEEILSPFFFSREHICRVFKKKTGKTLTEFLNDQRMILAIDRLTYSQDTILSICMELGFSSVAHFNTLFKEKYGIPPSEFRKRTRTPSISPKN